jgi:excisionase family DNA binding protein
MVAELERLSFSYEQATTATGLSRSTLERLVAADKLVAHKIGKRVLISRASLESLLRQDRYMPSQAELKEMREKKRARNIDTDAPSQREATTRKRRGAR